MTLPSTGPLKFSEIQTEFGGVNPVSLSEYYAGMGYVPVGTNGINGPVPNAGTLELSKFYNTTRVPTWGATPVQLQIIPNPNPAASDYFGASPSGKCLALSSDGSVMVVGAQRSDIYGVDCGAVYVYTRSENNWTLAQTLAPTISTGDMFGASVAISDEGFRIVVGQPNFDVGTTPNTGRISIYHGNGLTWALQQTINDPDPAISAYFGSSVGISGDGLRIISGAYGAANGGYCYVFTWGGSSWVQEQRLVGSNTAASDQFGFDTAINTDGSTIVVGAQYDDNGGANSGTTFIFARSTTTWSQQAMLSTNASAQDHAGYSVAVSGDGNTMVTASPDDDWPGGGLTAGSFNVFVRSGTTWSLQQWCKFGEIGGKLGTDISISADGNTILVAEYGKDVYALNANAGGAWIATRSGTTWSKVTNFQPSDPASGNCYGSCVALSRDGSTAAVGSQLATTASSTGAVYMYTRV